MGCGAVSCGFALSTVAVIAKALHRCCCKRRDWTENKKGKDISTSILTQPCERHETYGGDERLWSMRCWRKNFSSCHLGQNETHCASMLNHVYLVWRTCILLPRSQRRIHILEKRMWEASTPCLVLSWAPPSIPHTPRCLAASHPIAFREDKKRKTM